MPEKPPRAARTADSSDVAAAPYFFVEVVPPLSSVSLMHEGRMHVLNARTNLLALQCALKSRQLRGIFGHGWASFCRDRTSSLLSFLRTFCAPAFRSIDSSVGSSGGFAVACPTWCNEHALQGATLLGAHAPQGTAAACRCALPMRLSGAARRRSVRAILRRVEATK